jgi:transposase
VDYLSRPPVCAKKKQRDRLIALAARHPDWVLGFVDETWWSRVAHPALHAWAAESSLRLMEHALPKGEAEPKAVCCYGLLRTDGSHVLLRFVQGRPVSHVTTAFLSWLVHQMAAERKQVLVLIWDNASWHTSREVRTWIRAHNQRAKRAGGVRLLTCRLPVKSPWLNPIEPHWIHGKRAIVEPTRPLTATEIISRVCEYFAVEPLAPLQQHVA